MLMMIILLVLVATRSTFAYVCRFLCLKTLYSCFGLFGYYQELLKRVYTPNGTSLSFVCMVIFLWVHNFVNSAVFSDTADSLLL